MSLGELFPGNLGRVVLTRVALRLRMPELLRTAPTAALDPVLADKIAAAAAAVRQG